MACTLDGSAYAGRLEWIARLNRDGLRSHRREATSLELHYVLDVRDRVRELIRREAECCAFLTFDVQESENGVRVTITAPDRAGEMAGVLLAPFLPSEGG